jgi:hypothetical protein
MNWKLKLGKFLIYFNPFVYLQMNRPIQVKQTDSENRGGE